MKQSEIFTIVMVAAVGMLISFVTLKSLLGDPDLKVVSIGTVKPVSSTLGEPDPEIFNEDAINPTIEVYVGACQDVDRNGILDQAELTACGKASGGAKEGEKEEEVGDESDKKEEIDAVSEKKEDNSDKNATKNKTGGAQNQGVKTQTDKKEGR